MRSRDTRARAERALMELLAAAGPRGEALTVIGGLTADFLTEPTEPPHQGTLDVDVLLELGVAHDRDELDLGWLEEALAAAHFTPSGVGWRWWRDVDGIPVKLELLCDVYDSAGQEILLPGCRTASAQNLRGPAVAANDVMVRELARSGVDPAVDAVDVRCAGLGGYLLAKAGAAFGRRLTKDWYDFAFVLLHNNEGDPRAAARAAHGALPAGAWTDYAGIVRAVGRDFLDLESPGARAYAEQRALDGVEDDVDALAQDAVAAVQAFAEEFDRLAR